MNDELPAVFELVNPVMQRSIKIWPNGKVEFDNVENDWVIINRIPQLIARLMEK